MNRITQLYEQAVKAGLSQADARAWAEREHANERRLTKERGRFPAALCRTNNLKALGLLP